jgi:hypothetical protein
MEWTGAMAAAVMRWDRWGPVVIFKHAGGCSDDGSAESVTGVLTTMSWAWCQGMQVVVFRLRTRWSGATQMGCSSGQMRLSTCREAFF